ncbi:adenosine deaminase family protein [Xenorhabdus sp. BG5]|uniref:adenosine deaminase family protein n=1 Tax=Xenorhabdus sp. BG5 TaxID=2782014 RepID=UPI001880489D|nr:adenosine deaminase [Xenorhabdus sp. BG5]MBE8596003.1 adenosine deaminase [Xenorhabdus sp. BG5]
MNTLPIVIILLMLLPCLVNAGEVNTVLAKENETATARFFSKLIETNDPNIAELTMALKMMPKGADIHIHYSGAIYAETYLDWVGDKGYCIYDRTDPRLKIEIFRIETRQKSLLPNKNQPFCLEKSAVIANNAFYRKLLKVWSNKDFHNHYHMQKAPDQQFFDTFSYFSPLSHQILTDGITKLKNRAKNENVQYLEIMLNRAPSFEYPELAKELDALDPDADENTVFAALAPYADFMVKDPLVTKGISDYIQTEEAAVSGIDDDEFRIRLQSYVVRNASRATVFSSLYSAFSAAHMSKKIVGVNIVGPENGYIAIRDYKLHMLMFRYLKRLFPDVRLSLHAGELVSGMVPPEDLANHIRYAVDIAGANRIGHGVDIAREEKAFALLQVLREKEIPVEINLTSNDFILGVRGNKHPIKLYQRYGVPFVISSDDPGVSRGDLTHEFVIFATNYKPSYAEIKKTVFNSIQYSFLSPEEKSAEFQDLRSRFLIYESEIAGIEIAIENRDD